MSTQEDLEYLPKALTVERFFSGSGYPYLSAVSGKQFVGVFIDPSNTVVEDRETDNIKAVKGKNGSSDGFWALNANYWRIDHANTTPCSAGAKVQVCDSVRFMNGSFISGQLANLVST